MARATARRFRPPQIGSGAVSDLDAGRHAAEITGSATVADLNQEIRDVESDVGIANDARSTAGGARIAELVEIRTQRLG